MEKRKKIAVITGGSSGIGKAISKMLAESGIKVFCLSRTTCADNSNLLIKHIVTDVRNVSSLQSAAKKVASEESEIDILINCAGVGGRKSLSEITEKDYRATIDTNLSGVIFATQKFVPLIRRGGVICQISSIAGIRGFADWSLYCASKFAVEGFSAALRDELRSREIRVTVIRPGSVNTPFYAHVPESQKIDFIQPETIASFVLQCVLTDKESSVDTIEINNSAGDI